MKKINLIALPVLVMSILASCRQEGTWDGTDYYTGKDSMINGQRYRQSSGGYWYYVSRGMVNCFYPRTGIFNSVSQASHISSVKSSYRSSSSSHSGGFGSTGRRFSSSS